MLDNRALPVLIAFTCLASTMCGPPMPTQDEASAEYLAQKARFDGVDTALHKAISDIPHFGVPLASLPCTPPPVQKSLIPGMEKLLEADHCNSQKGKILDAQAAAIRAFQSKTVAELVKQHSLIGLDVTFKMPGGAATNELGKAGRLAPGYKNGTVRADKGTTIADRRIGWGLYHDADTQAFRRGLEVIWYFQKEQAKVQVRACVWMDGQNP